MTARERNYQTAAALAEAVRRLVDAFQPEKIYLFGSQSRGDARDDSDYDLMVIVPASEHAPYQRAQAGYRALWGVRLDAEILVWTAEEFTRQVSIAASLPAAILREGELLYAA